MLHVPVLLEESLDFLLHDLSGAYLDLTFGRGSHSQEILKLLKTGKSAFAQAMILMKKNLLIHQ